MILRISIVICVVLLHPSWGKMDLGTFSEKFEKNCFQNDANELFRVNGQDRPLSNTMENFISMAEKFEVANPGIDLKDELMFFLTEFLFENIKITDGRVSQRSEERAKFKNIYSLWDTTSGDNPNRLHFNNPFNPQEECSLYFMISHSILDKDTQLAKSYGVPYGNFSSNVFYNTELNPNDYYPQEIGVLQVRGTDGAVSLSKVLLGLLVGLKDSNRKTQLKSFTLNFQNIKHAEMWEKTVDALYMVTMAEVLMMTSWEGSERQGLAENGEWVSIPLRNGEKTEGFCPMVYKQQLVNGQKNLPVYSYSSVRGAADGLILGLTIPQISSTDRKLSQILRMYYSPRGIVVENNIEDINDKKVSFCNRDVIKDLLDAKIAEQMTAYGYLVASVENDVANSFGRSKPLYDKNKDAIFVNRANGFCNQITSLEKPEDLPAETFLDIIVVMDSSNTEKNFIDQQQIIGYLARQLDLRYSGSQMTILLDRKDETPRAPSRSSSKVDLITVVNDTFSSSCAACFVVQIPDVYSRENSQFLPSTLSREDVIVAVDQLLHERKVNETGKSGVNGKVVILFNYENGDGRASNDRVQGNIDKALRDLNMRHQDVLVYAVGLDQELLKKYARNDPSLVFLGTDNNYAEVADKILKKIFYAPALLQYSDCEEARNERAATYESFVSPNKIQHYTMPAEYFYKTFTGKIMFRSENGLIRVCYNRATMRPENEIKYCKDTTPTTGVDFMISNPCKSFTKDTCSPMYFAVMGMDPASETNGNQAQFKTVSCKANDRTCSTLDQIKFTVYHEGIRCSGCLGLGAPPAVIFLTLLLACIMFKRF